MRMLFRNGLKLPLVTAEMEERYDMRSSAGKWW